MEPWWAQLLLVEPQDQEQWVPVAGLTLLHHRQPHRHLHEGQPQDEHQQEDWQPAVAVGLEAEWLPADLKADQGQGVQAEQQAVAK